MMRSSRFGALKGLLLGSWACLAASSAFAAESNVENAARPSAATEQRVTELLEQHKCQDAILELHRTYSRNADPRLHLFYGRAFQQCGDAYGTRDGYRGVLAATASFSAAEIEEARRALAPPPPSVEPPPPPPDRAAIIRDLRKTADAYIIVGSVLLGMGITIAGAGLIATIAVAAQSRGLNFGAGIGAAGVIIVPTIFLTVPGGGLLYVGRRDKRALTATLMLAPGGAPGIVPSLVGQF